MDDLLWSYKTRTLARIGHNLDDDDDDDDDDVFDDDDDDDDDDDVFDIIFLVGLVLVGVGGLVLVVCCFVSSCVLLV